VSGRAGTVPVLFNAGAGTASTDESGLLRELGASRIRLLPTPPAEIRSAAAELVRQGAPIIAVAGGDGSMHAAAGSIARTPTALLPVPTGTLNNFARRVGIESVADAAAALDGGRSVRLPVGIVNDRVFLNTLTFGEYSRIVRMRERYRSYVGKWPAAIVAFTMALASLRRFNASISLEDRTLVRRTPFIWLGMGWGSFPQVPEALERRNRPDLELAILRSTSRSAGLAFLLRLGAGVVLGHRPVRDRSLEVFHTRVLTLDSSHLIDATADGEVLRLHPPVSVRVDDQALRVLCLDRDAADA
jgi:diacylglycerol kinase family enzyme